MLRKNVLLPKLEEVDDLREILVLFLLQVRYDALMKVLLMIHFFFILYNAQGLEVYRKSLSGKTKRCRLREYEKKMTVKPILRQVKILVFSKEFFVSVPQSCSPWEEAI